MPNAPSGVDGDAAPKLWGLLARSCGFDGLAAPLPSSRFTGAGAVTRGLAPRKRPGGWCACSTAPGTPPRWSRPEGVLPASQSASVAPGKALVADAPAWATDDAAVCAWAPPSGWAPAACNGLAVACSASTACGDGPLPRPARAAPAGTGAAATAASPSSPLRARRDPSWVVGAADDPLARRLDWDIRARAGARRKHCKHTGRPGMAVPAAGRPCRRPLRASGQQQLAKELPARGLPSTGGGALRRSGRFAPRRLAGRLAACGLQADGAAGVGAVGSSRAWIASAMSDRRCGGTALPRQGKTTRTRARSPGALSSRQESRPGKGPPRHRRAGHQLPAAALERPPCPTGEALLLRWDGPLLRRPAAAAA